MRAPTAITPAPVGQNQPEHVARPCTERHADSQFARALRDRVRRHSVDADRRKGETERGKRSEQRAEQRDIAQALVYQAARGANTMERQRGIEIGERPSHRLSEIVWRPRCPSRVTLTNALGPCAIGRNACNRVYGSARLAGKLTSLTTPITSSRGGWHAADALSQRILVWPETTRHRVVDDHDLRVARDVGCVERATGNQS